MSRLDGSRAATFSRAFGAILAIAILAQARDARANPSARLVYGRGAGAESCPDEEAVRAAVAARLGYAPFFPWAPTTVIVEVARSRGRFLADVKLIDEHGGERGARHLETGERCVDLMDAMALTISIVVDPLSLTSPRPPPIAVDPPEPPVVAALPASPPPPAPPPPPVTPSPPPAILPRPPSAPAIRPYVGLGLLASLGTAPGPAFGGNLFVGAAWRALSVEAEVRGDLTASGAATQAAVAPGGVQSWMLAGSLVPCVHLGIPVVIPFVCAVGSIERREVSAYGIANPTGGAVFEAAVGGRAGVEVAVGHVVVLRAWVGVAAELAPPALYIDQTVAYSFSPVSGGAGLAALVRFE